MNGATFSDEGKAHAHSPDAGTSKPAPSNGLDTAGAQRSRACVHCTPSGSKLLLMHGLHVVAGNSFESSGSGSPVYLQEGSDKKVQAALAGAPDRHDGTFHERQPPSSSGDTGVLIGAGTQPAKDAPRSTSRVRAGQRGLFAALTPTKRAKSATAQQQTGPEPIPIYMLVSRVLPKIKTRGGDTTPLGSGSAPSGDTPAKKSRFWMCACYS